MVLGSLGFLDHFWKDVRAAFVGDRESGIRQHGAVSGRENLDTAEAVDGRGRAPLAGVCSTILSLGSGVLGRLLAAVRVERVERPLQPLQPRDRGRRAAVSGWSRRRCRTDSTAAREGPRDVASLGAKCAGAIRIERPRSANVLTGGRVVDLGLAIRVDIADNGERPGLLVALDAAPGASELATIAQQIDVVDGAMPAQEAVDALLESINLLCNKPGGIEVSFPDDTIPSSEASNPEYSLDQINELELTWRNNYRQEDTAVLYFLYVDGHSDYDSDDTSVVGYAYHGASMAVFMGTVNGYPAQRVRNDLVKTVTVHEFGHLIGLVDNGADMVEDHHDPDHEPHCENEDCMMYWLNNYSGLIDILDETIPPFDDDCLADVAAAGGKDARGRPQPQ